MYKKAKPIYLITETPLHAGSGSDLGYIDLPIQREKHTGYPKIEGSGFKGALRQAFEGKDSSDDHWIKLNRIFGYDEQGLSHKVKDEFKDKKDFAGALGLTDVRILLFPVKSLKGTFAWVTCRRVLTKFHHELKDICEIETDLFEIPNEIGVSGESLYIDEAKSKIQLEEYIYSDLKVNPKIKELSTWFKTNIFHESLSYWQAAIENNLVVLSDEDFADFMKFSTEVHTRIKIDNETGTVVDGALFTQEYLPAESVMYGLSMFSAEFKKNGLSKEEVEDFFDRNKPKYFQLGGNATIGKGIIHLISKDRIK
jgi:CRISPR-associated protein Cmr4